MSTAESIADRASAALHQLPLVAILRGIRPDEAAAVGRRCTTPASGLIEVPLNSPEPLASIATLRRLLPADALVGAGTVLRAGQAAEVRAAGGRHGGHAAMPIRR